MPIRMWSKPCGLAGGAACRNHQSEAAVIVEHPPVEAVPEPLQLSSNQVPSNQRQSRFLGLSSLSLLTGSCPDCARSTERSGFAPTAIPLTSHLPRRLLPRGDLGAKVSLIRTVGSRAARSQTTEPAVESAENSELPRRYYRVSRATPSLSLVESLLARARSDEKDLSDTTHWHGWSGSSLQQKTLLVFRKRVAPLEFRSIAIPFWSEARLDWYLKAWGSLSSPTIRAVAAIVARANVEATNL